MSDKLQNIDDVLAEVRSILIERLEGDFQIIWTGFDEELQTTMTYTTGYGNINARLSAAKLWERRASEFVEDSILDTDIVLWEEEYGEPE